MNYQKDTKIDNSALDVEWLKQGTLMFQYTENQAVQGRKKDEAEEELEFCIAELDKKIRTTPETFEITGKVTETVIKNTISMNEDFIEQKKKVINAKFAFEVAKGAVKAIDAKKAALENLVKLYGQSYFAGPSIPRDLSKEWEQAEKQKQGNKKVLIRKRK